VLLAELGYSQPELAAASPARRQRWIRLLDARRTVELMATTRDQNELQQLRIRLYGEQSAQELGDLITGPRQIPESPTA